MNDPDRILRRASGPVGSMTGARRRSDHGAPGGAPGALCRL